MEVEGRVEERRGEESKSERRKGGRWKEREG